MNKYNITMPFAGHVSMEVEAENKDQVVEKFYEMFDSLPEGLRSREIDVEWDFYQSLSTGNVSHVSQDEMEIEEIETNIIEEKFTSKWIKSELKNKISKHFNELTGNIKLVIFKTTMISNGDYYEYRGVLSLIDKDFKEIDHNIVLSDLLPDEFEQKDYIEENDGEIVIDNLTFEWNY